MYVHTLSSLVRTTMMFCIIIDSSGPDAQVVSQGLSQNLRDGFSLGGMSQVFFLSLMLDWTFLFKSCHAGRSGAI